MKIHITNLYNFMSSDGLVERQHQFAEAGLSLGFLEMGLFAYPVETDTPSELSKRLDGVIAALEPKDVVFIQLPTANGLAYERLLVRKIKAYPETKVVFLLHGRACVTGTGELQDEYKELCRMADVVIRARDAGIGFMQKMLMDAVDRCLEEQMQPEEVSVAAHEDEMQIGFGLHDATGNYSALVGTAMQSIVENTISPICFHILHDETLNQENRKKLTQVALRSGRRIRFHFLDKKLFAEVARQTGVFTIGAMFRLMLPDFLPEVEKIIYLDADLIVNRDIKELWGVDIKEYCMAAVPDAGVVDGIACPFPVVKGEVEAKEYFNSGVLYMNLERIRKNGNMREQVLDYLIQNRTAQCPDQDALNYVYRKKTLLLDADWNYFAVSVRADQEKVLYKRIYHFASTRGILYTMTAMDMLYYEIAMRTPWGVEESRRQLDRAFERVTDRVSQLEKVISKLGGASKKHIFYGQETPVMKNLYKIFPPGEGDYRVLANPVRVNNFILECKDLSVLESEQEPFIVFALPESDEWTAVQRLEAMGLKNGSDFFVIPRLLHPDKGGYM